MTTAGLYVIPATDYLADPTPTPSLNSTLARILLAESPQHCWYASPRLNPDYVREEKTQFDIGTAAHALILEGDESGFELVEAADYRTKAAQAVRDSARANGRTPLLPYQLIEVRAMAEAVKLQLSEYERPIPFTDGLPEQTIVWRDEGGVWCRGRLDWLHADRRTVDDLKSVGGSANPEQWSRTLFSSGFDVQAALYLRGIKALFNVEAEFRFVLCETTPPYAVSVVGLAPEALDLADRKVKRAIALWQECLETNAWPGFPRRTVYADPPPWETARWEQAEYLRRGPVVDDGRPLDQQLGGVGR